MNMNEILIAEAIILLISVLFAYFAWRLYGIELVNKFGPGEKIVRSKTSKNFSKKQRLGMFSEIFRAVEVYLISLLVFLSCSTAITGKLSRSDLSQFPWAKWILIIASSATIVWCVYFGPKGVMDDFSKDKQFFSPYVWKNIRLPYLMWIPYIIGVYYVMGGLIILILTSCATREFTTLTELELLIRSLHGSSISDIQFGLYKTIQYGRLISLFSQKYIMVSIIAFAFVVIEQQSYMEKTQYLGNLNILKWGIVIIFIAAIVMGFGYLPMKYLSIHNYLVSSLDSFMDGYLQNGMIDAGLTEAALNIQDSLDSYDLNWLFIKNITGYGNLLTLSVIGGGILIQRLFFKEFPLRKIFEYLLPESIIGTWDGLIQTLGFVEEEKKKKSDKGDHSNQ